GMQAAGGVTIRQASERQPPEVVVWGAAGTRSGTFFCSHRKFAPSPSLRSGDSRDDSLSSIIPQHFVPPPPCGHELLWYNPLAAFRGREVRGVSGTAGPWSRPSHGQGRPPPRPAPPRAPTKGLGSEASQETPNGRALRQPDPRTRRDRALPG